MGAADRNSADHIILAFRQHNTDRKMAINRSIGRIESTTASIEAHLASNTTLEIFGKSSRHCVIE